MLRAAEAFGESGKTDEFFPSVFSIAEYDPNRPLEIGDARITFAPTVHYVPCWAIRVAQATGGGDLGYTADTGPGADLTGFFRGVRVLVAEGTSLRPLAEPLEERGHFTAGEAAELARDSDASTLVLTHLWEENGFDAYREQAAAVFRGRLELARPGLNLTW